MNQQKSFWIKGTASIVKRNLPLWYMSCSSCHRPSSEPNAQQSFCCRFCKTPNAIAKPRARVDVEIQDFSGNLTASLMGKIAEDFLQNSAYELMILSQTNKEVEENIRMALENECIFYIKVNEIRQNLLGKGKVIMSQSSASGHKYEVFSFQNSTAQLDKENSTTTETMIPKSSDSFSHAEIVSSRLTRKRPLFQVPESGLPASKKLPNKID